MKTYEPSWLDLRARASAFPKGKAYGVPRGGTYAALLHGDVADDPEQADFIVDDVVDSGRTRAEWTERTGKPFYALVDKTNGDEDVGWVRFPWERGESDAEDAVVRLLQLVGEDPDRPGLLDTPKRVVKAWRQMTVGYQQDPAEILSRSFERDGYDQMIMCRDIEFYSTCEHHLLPFSGVATVAYLPGQPPNDRVVGLSKMARLVDCFARRLQIQEKMTRQIADAMDQHLKPEGVGVLVRAQHLCMACRGVQKHSSSMVTSALLGCFMRPDTRSEFMALAQIMR